MPHCVVTLSANAGISLEWDGYRIWVDAVHEGPVPGFSAVTPELWSRMRDSSAFSHPDLICFTHNHADHCSRRLAEEALALWPQAAVVMPEQLFSEQVLLAGEEIRLNCGPLTIRFLRLPHEGDASLDVPHYGLLISDSSFRLLLPGDCAVASPVLTGRLAGEPVDAAILDFPWITLRKGRKYLEEVLRPGQVLIYHLPFEKEDVKGFLPAARRAAEAYPNVRLLTQPFQREAL